ncbi:MAG TPA: NAD(P)/FAD-dependent oxidoreductase [Roseiflexaceae bacterium]|nr:NAD(P)/FAD-dependent oxidoreductase [Roseiflexaceae bacterium]
METYDIVVIGAGIGGLTTAALLARDGYRVLVLESHIEPGGCASSYERKRPDGARYVFDVGATLFAGFTPGGAHHWVAAKLGVDWPVRRLEPAMEVWLPDRRVTRWGDERWIEERRLAFPRQAWEAEGFWREQERLADIAWRFAARHPPMPPENPRDLLGLVSAARPELALLLPHLWHTVDQRLQTHAIDDRRLRAFVDGQLLISAQTAAQECSWLYGAVALDFARIGAHYVEGGAWGLARTLEAALTRDGGEIRYRQRVARILTRDGRTIGVETDKGERYSARHVVGNITIWDAARLLGDAAPARLQHEIADAPRGWGAFTLYLGVDEAALPPGMAEHHQVIACYDKPLGEANSVFISAHPADDTTRAPAGQRALTLSTHTNAERWWHWRDSDPPRYRAEKAVMAERMLDTAALALPNLRSAIRYQQSGTPFSFWRYTHRQHGMVGGLPQRLRNSGLLSLGPRATGVGGLWLVGDSTFPGQSTAAVTQSGIRAYHAIRREPA